MCIRLVLSFGVGCLGGFRSSQHHESVDLYIPPSTAMGCQSKDSARQVEFAQDWSQKLRFRGNGKSKSVVSRPSSVSKKFAVFGQLDPCVVFYVHVPSGSNIRCGQAQCRSNVEPRPAVYNLFLFSKEGGRGRYQMEIFNSCVSANFFFFLVHNTSRFPIFVIAVPQI